uniref:Thioredoxin domain-containing protein n=1 Tax=Pseudictyota dubia TaxID=2749911 RepID=A0A7R9Z5A9_9STRA|mmetsp:Transcript_2341/g.4066  ORF Transcript_2341/g.4066 Transcript_2341/m.4066 type:complete len:298 (+) Transcript_2341:58-951(+)
MTHPRHDMAERILRNASNCSRSSSMHDSASSALPLPERATISKKRPASRLSRSLTGSFGRPPLGIGDMAPDFTLPRVAIDEDQYSSFTVGSDTEGSQEEDRKLRTVSLSDFRGKKVMLCFHRYASCPLCNMAIDELKGHYKKLAWASKLEVIKVFPTPKDSEGWDWLKGGVESGDDEGENIPVASMEGKYPFIILSDDAEETYTSYSVQSSVLGRLGTITHIPSNSARRTKFAKSRGMSSVQLMAKAIKAPKEGDLNRLPAEFLINEEGRIVDCFRAKTIDEHIPIERVSQFLMGKA